MKYFCGHAFFFAKDSKQQMLGADVTVIEPFGFLSRVSKNTFAFVRKREIDGRRDFLPNRGSTLNFLANALDRRVVSQETIGQVFVFADQPQQKMLGFDRRAPKLASFVASEEYDPLALSVYLSNIIF